MEHLYQINAGIDDRTYKYWLFITQHIILKETAQTFICDGSFYKNKTQRINKNELHKINGDFIKSVTYCFYDEIEKYQKFVIDNIENTFISYISCKEKLLKDLKIAQSEFSNKKIELQQITMPNDEVSHRIDFMNQYTVLIDKK